MIAHRTARGSPAIASAVVSLLESGRDCGAVARGWIGLAFRLLAAFERRLKHRCGRERVGPTGIERSLGQYFAGLLLREATIERAVEVECNLYRLT
jgi:hypothetical protein